MRGSKIGKVIAIAVIVILVAVLSVVGYGAAVWFGSDRIVKLSYTGLENMFTVHDEYYAVRGSHQFRIPKALAQTFVDGDIDYIGDTDPEVGRNFLVQVCYSEDGRPQFEGKTTLTHSYDAKYVIEVSNPGPEKCEVTREEEKIMLSIAEHFHDFSKDYKKGEDNWVAGNTGFTVIFSYDAYFNGDEVIFEIHKPGSIHDVYSYSDGDIVKVMSVPSNATFDVAIWKKED